MVDVHAPMTESRGAARQLQGAAQDLRQAVARLEQVLSERQERSEALARDGNAEANRIADHLETVAANLEQIAKREDTDRA